VQVRDQAKTAIAALNGKEVYDRKIALKEAEQQEQEGSNNFKRPKREFRGLGGGANEEIDGNRW
jgi:hypothetical protein